MHKIFPILAPVALACACGGCANPKGVQISSRTYPPSLTGATEAAESTAVPGFATAQEPETATEREYYEELQQVKAQQAKRDEIASIKDPLESAEQAAWNFPNDPENWIRLARAQLQNRLYQESLLSLDHALLPNPENPEAWQMRVKVYDAEGNQAEAAYCRDALEKIKEALANVAVTH